MGRRGIEGEGWESKDELLGEKKIINRANEGMVMLLSLQEERMFSTNKWFREVYEKQNQEEDS